MSFQRTAYYPGQFLTDRDLTADQAYLAEKRQVHNRLLHGHGVVCGFRVAPSAKAGYVTIEPGLALDPYGNELRLLQELQVDLRAKMEQSMRRRGGSGYGRPTVLIALRYEERSVDPLPAFLPQVSPDAPSKPARVAEGYRLDLLLEPELDLAAKQVLVWQSDLLSITREPNSGLTTPEVDCPYVFLARVTDTGDGYQVDTSVQRPVVNPELFFELVRQYAPDLFLGAQSLPAFREAIVAQVGQIYSETVAAQLAQRGVNVADVRQIGGEAPESIDVVVYVDANERVIGAGPAPSAGGNQARLTAAAAPAAPSPLYRAALRAVSALDVPSLQEGLVAALVTAVLERLPLSRTAAASVEAGVETVGAVVDGWAEIAPRLGTGAASALRDLQAAVQQVTHQVLNVILPRYAMYVEQVPAADLAGALGVSPALAEEMLDGAREYAR